MRALWWILGIVLVGIVFALTVTQGVGGMFRIVGMFALAVVVALLLAVVWWVGLVVVRAIAESESSRRR